MVVLMTTSSCRSDPELRMSKVTLPAVTDFGEAFNVNSSMVTLEVPPARAEATGTRDTASAPTTSRRYGSDGMWQKLTDALLDGGCQRA